MKRGDVVLVDRPYRDRTGSKLRPAVVVQADFLNGLIADTVLVSITRTVRPARRTEALIDPAVEVNSGLRHVSAASCNNFLTIDPALIYRTIGYLGNAAAQNINDKLKTALDLP
jgi:mRNA-degrading endonuclease toxin of MazEF toxin-antitoxin module